MSGVIADRTGVEEPSWESGFKEAQRTTWNGLAEPWNRWGALFEKGASPLTRKMLESAEIGPGNSVLDLGTGIGDPALEIAELVGSGGFVLGIDQAGDMLAIGRERASARNLSNIDFRSLDLEEPDISTLGHFDAAVARFSLMFLPRPEACLQSVQKALKPGTHLVCSAWATPDRAPVISLGFGVAAELLKLPPPPPHLPGPFSMSDGTRLPEMLFRSGFQEIETSVETLSFCFKDSDEFVAFSWDLLPSWLRTRFEAEIGQRDESPYSQRVSQHIASAYDANGRVILKADCLLTVARTNRA